MADNSEQKSGAVTFDSAERDREAAEEPGINASDYQEARQIRQEINAIRAQVRDHGSYERTEQDRGSGRQEKHTYSTKEAYRLERSLTREAERLEGYPWSERSHEGFMALIAAIMRAVKYIVDSSYREQVRMMNKLAANRAAREETIRAAEGIREKQKEKGKELEKTATRKGPELSHDEKGVQNPEPGKEPANQHEIPENSLPAAKYEAPGTEKETEDIARLLSNPAIFLTRPDLVSKEAEDILNQLKAATWEKSKRLPGYLKAAERGEDEARKFLLAKTRDSVFVRQYPVLARGVKEENRDYCISYLMAKAPDTLTWFSDQELVHAIPSYAAYCGKLKDITEEQSVNRLYEILQARSPETWAAAYQVISDKNLFPTVQWVVVEPEGTRQEIPSQDPYQDQENTGSGMETDIAHEERAAAEGDVLFSGAENIRVPVQEENVPGQDAANLQGDQGTDWQPPFPETKVTDMEYEDGVPEDLQKRFEYEKALEDTPPHEPWDKREEFRGAIYEAKQKNPAYELMPDPAESLLTDILTAKPEYLCSLYEDERTYERVMAAAMSNLSILKYVSPNSLFPDAQGHQNDFNTLAAEIRGKMPEHIQRLALEQNRSEQEIAEEICRTPKGRYMEQDSREVRSLKRKIMKDFERSGRGSCMQQPKQKGQGLTRDEL